MDTELDPQALGVVAEGGEVAQTEPKYDVFLSYNSKDKDAVAAIYTLLDGLKLDVWFDLVNFRAGLISGQLGMAIQDSKTAAVFIGKDGLGPWQSQEVEATLQARVEDDQFEPIPVLLPGASISKIPLLLRAYKSVQFENTLNNMAVIRELYRLITGGELPRGAFEIHVEIEDAKVTCFAAVPPEGGRRICDTIRSAVVQINKDPKVVGNEQVRFQCGIPDPPQSCVKGSAVEESADCTPHPSHLFSEIRAAEAVVADCTPTGPDGTRDATVMYQLGLAQAIGKPTIIVTAPGDDLRGILVSPEDRREIQPYVVHCDRSQRNFEEKLRKDLIDKMTCIARSAVFGLIAPDSRGISAAYSDFSGVGPRLFQSIHFVFDDGLIILRHFREIGRHLFRLGRDIDELLIDLENAKLDCKFPAAAIRRVEDTFDRYLHRAFTEFNEVFEENDNEFSRETLEGFLNLEKTNAWKAFKRLKEKTSGGAQECVKKAAGRFETTVIRIREYFAAFKDFSETLKGVKECFKNTRDPQPKIEALAGHFVRLEKYMQLVEESTRPMLLTLLELFVGKNKRNNGRQPSTVN